MTKSKKVALLSMLLASAEQSLELAGRLMTEATPADVLAGNVAGIEAAYDKARSLVAECRDNLRAAQAARNGYQCPHTAALVAANID